MGLVFGLLVLVFVTGIFHLCSDGINRRGMSFGILRHFILESQPAFSASDGCFRSAMKMCASELIINLAKPITAIAGFVGLDGVSHCLIVHLRVLRLWLGTGH